MKTCAYCFGKGTYSRCYDEKGYADFHGDPAYVKRGLLENKPCPHCKGTGQCKKLACRPCAGMGDPEDFPLPKDPPEQPKPAAWKRLVAAWAR